MPALIYFFMALIQVPFLVLNGYIIIHAETQAQLITGISLICLSAFGIGWCCAFGTIKVIQKFAA